MERQFHEDGSAPQGGQVFVFGSNLSGRHAGGAARAAADLYGAEEGVGEGLTGNSYALPTVAAEMAGPLSLEDIAAAVGRFIEFARANAETRFLVTRVGCGIAGFTDEQIAPMFRDAPLSCSLPEQWEPHVSKPETSLVLRVSGPNGEAHGNFLWPLTVGAEVTCPDWEDNSECGNGLHGWLYGQGDHNVAGHWNTEGAKWMVLEVASADIRMLGGKVKFPRCTVRFVGNRPDAAAYIIANEPRAANVAVIGAVIAKGDKEAAVVGALGTATAGDRGTATAGDSGTATAGDRGTATAGDRGTATAGDSGTATAGALGTATAGDRGTATAGALGTATAGDRGTATAGDSGTATAGDRGTATAGDRGTATAGDSGTATAGDRGTATAGDSGTISIRYWDSKADRYRVAIGYIGEDGLEAGVAYRLDNNKFVKAE